MALPLTSHPGGLSCGILLLPLTFLLLWTIADTTPARSRPDLLQRQFSAVTTNRNVRDITTCRTNCTNARARPVCGSDGNTYPHRCAVKRLRDCEKRDVRVLTKGRCPGAPGLAASARSALRPSSSSPRVPSPSSALVPGTSRGGSKCLAERRQALDAARRPGSGIYIPKCKEDGYYAKVQCHQATGYCWCATGDGKPIPGSSVKGKNINCRGTKGKRTSSRRQRKRARKPKGCNPTQRSTFNTNLISLFSEEFERVPKPTPPSYPGAPKDLPIKSESDSILDTPEKRVIEWKFSELDTNKDNKLRRKEIQSLRRLVKKLVQPKACARNFDEYCDLDRDGRIARNEWSVCLGVDINKEHLTTPTPPETQDGDEEDEDTDEDVDEEGDEVEPSLWNKQTTLLNGGSSRLSSQETQQTQSEMPVRRSCMEERRAAEDMDRMDPAGRIFIPVCTADAKFKREQCHTSTGYCWCVDETTGKPIPGTSTHNVMPDCSNTQGREFKGCPYPQKKKFLIELMDQLTSQIVEHANNASEDSRMPEPDPEHSLEERAVRWKHRLLDRNRNGELERRELKAFKREIRKRKTLRKCSRNFIKYCDGDNDKTITMEEWVACMGLNDGLFAEQQRNLPVNPKRQGPNPFSKYLRS